MNSFKTISGWGGYPKTNSEVISPRNIDEYKINLNNYTMDWGPGYKIIEINDKKIVGYSDGSKEGDNYRNEFKKNNL